MGVDDTGAALSDPKDVSTYSHMFSVWETLFAIKKAMELSGYKGPAQKVAMLEAMESITGFAESNEFPQGDKVFNGKTHQSFGHQYVSKVSGGRLEVIHRTTIEESFYPDEVDYTKMSF